ncbi:hypothetical protein K6U06_03850 [Acidiferrimicrobium sp. IK]|uniref:acyl-CoA dehydrogenase family protein n=1 Tax=Acidiferrimicrobium sp. IK TaxID=2871700 RepID=UPI0021CB6223|nr:acyl-CoA dehydrogenase family protein [Acidiferrimicrobium sp. IK]MCU4183482.1 hypothetical protein [Acidiferrimicrobium sp. IK]
MDTDTEQLLRRSLTKVLVDEADRELSARLATLGWAEVLDDDAPTAFRALFEVKGQTAAPGDALGPAMARAAALILQRPELAGAGVVLPSSLRPDELSSRVDKGRVAVAGVTGSPPGRAPVLVPVASGDDVAVTIIPAGVEWSVTELSGTDASIGLWRVAAEIDQADVELVTGVPARESWAAAVATGRWALGAELLGVGRHVVATAVEYAAQRHQYGRPIGSFQAVQHRLAGAHASLVGAGRVVEVAANSGSPWVATVAKAVAGRAAEMGCTQAQQTFGAIGFTWEHEFHRYLRRTYALDWLLGDWRSLEVEIGQRLQATRSVPRVGML